MLDKSIASVLIDQLLDEKSELDAKIGRLAVFIEKEPLKTVTEYHLGLLEQQLYAMKDYSDSLGKRIADIEQSEKSVNLDEASALMQNVMSGAVNSVDIVLSVGVTDDGRPLSVNVKTNGFLNLNAGEVNGIYDLKA